MFERIANGWELAKQSFQVLRRDKVLVLFPILSGLSCLMVLATFAVPLWTTGQAELWLDEGDVAHKPLAYVIAFAFYFVNYFVIIFFNSALVACAVDRFKGGEPTLTDGLRAATERLPQIAGWALVSATIGLVLKMIAERSGKIGEIVTGLIGAAWSIGTYFVVPVIVVERANPLDAFKRSLSVLRRAWGEALIANSSIGLFVFLAGLVAIAPTIVAFWIGNTAFIIAAISTTVIALLAIWLISTTLDYILLGALYLYAAEGRAPEGYDESTLAAAFRRK